MIKQDLSGAWQFHQVEKPDWLPAAVPGCVFTDLMHAGMIPDPFIGENEKKVQWVAQQDWEYRREFNITSNWLSQDRIDLVCEGLDTLAEISVNGQVLKKTDNIFRQYRIPVTQLLREGSNTLSIVFRSPMAYIQARQKARKLPSIMNGGMAQIRKVQSHFGWDWGPVLPTSGIWKDIFLEGVSTARLADVHIRQQHDAGQVMLHIHAVCERLSPGNLSLSLHLVHPDGMVQNIEAPLQDDRTELALAIENPQLWWPNGLGKQPLYQARVRLYAGDQLLDERNYQIGLRTLVLDQSPDAWGNAFTFVVNGVPLFAKGANWIPADSFIMRLDHARLEHLIESAATANMNMLRVWGGGYYESDDFYDLCDRKGILVWQDFAFACAPYPLDEPAFLENVQSEVVENIRRLRHHASLALWCGNNEIEMMWGLWKRNKPLTQAYRSFFHQRLPEWVQSEDPDHPYWPSSPSSNDFMHDTNSDVRGDTHLWQVWHGLEPFTFFRTRLTRFASEFGLEALPALPTITTFAGTKGLHLNARVMRHHQRSAGGNDKMLYYLTTRFRRPKGFADLIYLTQIVQSESIRIAVEHWRRNRPRCSGALYWQLNDCWPVTSWSSIDYAGRWKALQYAARRFYDPVAISIEENDSQAAIYVANDLPTEWDGYVRWSLETLDGDVLESKQEFITAKPLAATCMTTLDFSRQIAEHGADKLVFVAELWQGLARQATRVLLFAPEKDLKLPNPELNIHRVTLKDNQLTITVGAKRLARFVRLSLTGADVIFSDNFFDLPGGRSETITCPLPTGWTLEQAKEALKVRSLVNIKPAGPAWLDRLTHFQVMLTPTNLFTRVLFKIIK